VSCHGGGTNPLAGSYLGDRSLSTCRKPTREVKREELVMQTTCGAYELLFWGGKSISQPEPSATKLRDVVWATWTSTLGWPVQGIWPAVSEDNTASTIPFQSD